MEHNPQLYDKIQKLYEEYWEISSRFHKDSDYYPIIKSLEDILYENPDNEYALQLKIIVKRSYKRPPKEELKVLCEQLRRINPKNQFAKTSRFSSLELKLKRIFGQNTRLSKIQVILFLLITFVIIANLIENIIDLIKLFVR